MRNPADVYLNEMIAKRDEGDWFEAHHASSANGGWFVQAPVLQRAGRSTPEHVEERITLALERYFLRLEEALLRLICSEDGRRKSVRADELGETMTKRAAAKQAGVSAKTIERAIAAGQLKTVRVSRRNRVRREDLAAYLSGRGLEESEASFDAKLIAARLREQRYGTHGRKRSRDQ